MKRIITALIIIALAAGATFGVWQFLHKRSVANDTAAKQPTNQTPPTLQQQKSEHYLIVKEWGVKFKLDDSIDDATYTYKDTAIIYVTAGKLRQVKGCENPELISIQRGKHGDPIGASNVDEVLANNPSALTKLDDYYYIAIPSPMNCAENSDASTLAVLNGVTDAFKKAVKEVERSD